MRKKSLLLPAMAMTVCFMASNAFAQDATAQQSQVKTIFSFKDEIGLTDDQELKLKALLYDEQSLVDANNDSLKTLGADLSKMIEDKADIDAIRAKLEEISKIQVDTTCRNIEDSRKVETILTPDQLAKWKDIQKRFSAPATPPKS
jgi:Spy/CpxP family protein refolding chaperone